MRLVEIGAKVVEYGGYLILLGAAIEYVRAIAREESREAMRQEAREAVRQHELWEHQVNDEQDA